MTDAPRLLSKKKKNGRSTTMKKDKAYQIVIFGILSDGVDDECLCRS